jgi:hypothetical protein
MFFPVSRQTEEAGEAGAAGEMAPLYERLGLLATFAAAAGN